jgi:hypothetical protein
MKVRPTRLRENSELDMACMRLVREGAGSLGLVFEVQGETLSFSKGITVEEARELMRRAQEVYRPPLVRRA